MLLLLLLASVLPILQHHPFLISEAGAVVDTLVCDPPRGCVPRVFKLSASGLIDGATVDWDLAAERRRSSITSTGDECTGESSSSCSSSNSSSSSSSSSNGSGGGTSSLGALTIDARFATHFAYTVCALLCHVVSYRIMLYCIVLFQASLHALPYPCCFCCVYFVSFSSESFERKEPLPSPQALQAATPYSADPEAYW